MKYLLATLTYTCSCGRENHLYRYFASEKKPVTHVDLMPYMPREWPCSACRMGSPPYVEVSVKWFEDSEASELGIPFEPITL